MSRFSSILMLGVLKNLIVKQRQTKEVNDA